MYIYITAVCSACCTGESVCENLSAMGVKLITSTTEAEMRLCTSLVDERFGETTEIIEPWSAEVGSPLLLYGHGRDKRNLCRRKKHLITPAGQKGFRCRLAFVTSDPKSF